MYDESRGFTKYEIARMIGARSLQLAMGAPFLVKLDEKDLEKFSYNPLEIAKKEFKEGVLPISVKRPNPKAALAEKTMKSDVKQASQGEE